MKFYIVLAIIGVLVAVLGWLCYTEPLSGLVSERSKKRKFKFLVNKIQFDVVLVEIILIFFVIFTFIWLLVLATS